MTGPDPKALLSRVTTPFAGFTAGQKVMTGIAALAVVIGGVFFVQWVSTPSYAPLFTGLSSTDASAVTAKLSDAGEPYQLADGGGTVLVPQADVYQQRINLAGAGLPAGDSGTKGYSLLDNQSMTSSDFQQKVTYQRALEGELAKTIEAIDGIQSAVVHLAVPQDDVFTADATKPTGSVLVKTAPGTTLSSTAVDSIVHLVSGSVPKLQAADVTVADASGQVLSAAGDASGLTGGSDARQARQKAVGDAAAANIQSMLDKVVGPGKAVVRVDATLNFDAQTTESQTYVPTKPLTALSSQTSKESYTGSSATAAGVLGSTNTTTGAGGNGSYTKSESSSTNAVGTLKETTTATPGKVQRLSVAVLLDNRAAGSVNMTDVQNLVSAAAGLDPKRGDVVQVSTMAFDTTAAKTAAKELADAAAAKKTQDMIDLGKTIGLAVLVLLVLVLGLRAAKKRSRPADPEEIEMYRVPEGPSPATAVLEMAEARAALPAAEHALVGAGAESVEALAKENPEDVARLLRGWMAEETR